MIENRSDNERDSSLLNSSLIVFVSVNFLEGQAAFRHTRLSINERVYYNGILSRGLRNSEIRFGIGISKTEPYRTELFLEFRKRRNSDFFGISAFALRN